MSTQKLRGLDGRRCPCGAALRALDHRQAGGRVLSGEKHTQPRVFVSPAPSPFPATLQPKTQLFEQATSRWSIGE